MCGTHGLYNSKSIKIYAIHHIYLMMAMWPKHVRNLYEGIEYTLIWPMIFEATLKTVLHLHIKAMA
jgi:hypothetical protein